MSSFTSEFSHGAQLEAEQRDKAVEAAAVRQAKIAAARAEAAQRTVAQSAIRSSSRSQAIAEGEYQNSQAAPSEAVREEAAQNAQNQIAAAAAAARPRAQAPAPGSFVPIGTAARLENLPQYQYSVTANGVTKSFDTPEEAQSYIDVLDRQQNLQAGEENALGRFALYSGQGGNQQVYQVTYNGVTKTFNTSAEAQSYINDLNEENALSRFGQSARSTPGTFSGNRRAHNGPSSEGGGRSPATLFENAPGSTPVPGTRGKQTVAEVEDEESIKSIGDYVDTLGSDIIKNFSGPVIKNPVGQKTVQVVETGLGDVGNFFKESSQGYEAASRKNLASKDVATRFLGGLESEGEGFTGSFATLLGKPNESEDRNLGTDVGELLGTAATVYATGGIGEIAGITDVAAVAKGAAFGGTINVGLEELFGVPRSVPITTTRVTRDKYGNETETESTDYEQISASPGFDDVLSAFQSGADIGALGTVAGAGVAKAIGSVPKVGSKVLSTLASKGAKGFAAKSGFGAAVNSLFTLPFSQNPKDIAENALIGAGFAGPGERIGSALRGQIEPLLPGGPDVASKTGVTIGKTAGTPVYETENLAKYGGKKIRVVADVTENPATGVEQTAQYGGRKIGTAHATLTPEYFDLRTGKSTILRGQGIRQLIDETAANYGFKANDVTVERGKNGTTNLRLPDGRRVPLITKGGGIAAFRQTRQIMPFYSAPGSDESINIYGGYAGIGDAEEGGRVIFGGKARPTALITDETLIENIARRSNESESDFIDRYLSRSGKTSVGVENLLGSKKSPISTERQVETTTSYERFGKQLPGSKFVSKGKVGTVQVRESPDSLFTDQIPGLRNIEKAVRTRYTNLNVYRGTFEENTDEDLMKRIASNDFLDVGEYNQQREQSVGSVSSNRLTSGLITLVPQSLSKRSPSNSRITFSEPSISIASIRSSGGSLSSKGSESPRSVSVSRSKGRRSASLSRSPSSSASSTRSNSSSASLSRSQPKSRSSQISTSKKSDDDSYPRLLGSLPKIKRQPRFKRKELSNPVDVFEVLGL